MNVFLICNLKWPHVGIPLWSLNKCLTGVTMFFAWNRKWFFSLFVGLEQSLEMNMTGVCCPSLGAEDSGMPCGCDVTLSSEGSWLCPLSVLAAALLQWILALEHLWSLLRSVPCALWFAVCVLFSSTLRMPPRFWNKWVVFLSLPVVSLCCHKVEVECRLLVAGCTKEHLRSVVG